MFEQQTIVVTGAGGFLGQHVVRQLRQTAALHVVTLPRTMLDLRYDYKKVFETFFTLVQADLSTEDGQGVSVIHLAHHGDDGISTSQTTPHTLASDMLRMDVNVIEACVGAQVSKLLCVGSVVAYPEHAPVPTTESALWDGPPAAIDMAYAQAKRTQLTLLQAARAQYGLEGVHLILGNLYGPGDHSNRVIPATIRKIAAAVHDDATSIRVWGYPGVSRSFLYVEDAAAGILRALASYNNPAPLTLAGRRETKMHGLVTELSALMGWTGQPSYDTSKPTGHRRRCFDLDNLSAALDWLPPTTLEDGLRSTVDWMRANPDTLKESR